MNWVFYIWKNNSTANVWSTAPPQPAIVQIPTSVLEFCSKYCWGQVGIGDDFGCFNAKLECSKEEDQKKTD
jgi:hypothetical protein